MRLPKSLMSHNAQIGLELIKLLLMKFFDMSWSISKPFVGFPSMIIENVTQLIHLAPSNVVSCAQLWSPKLLQPLTLDHEHVEPKAPTKV